MSSSARPGPAPSPGRQPCARPPVWGSDRSGGAGVDCLESGAAGGGSYSPGLRRRRLCPAQGHPVLTPEDQGPLPVGSGGKGTTHLGSGSGVAQEVGAGDQVVPEAATPTAPHTAVAASDCDAGRGGARGDGSAHLGSRAAAGGRLFGRLPAGPAQHGAGAQVVLSGVARAAAVGALGRETRLRRDGESGTACSGGAPHCGLLRAGATGQDGGAVQRGDRAWEAGLARWAAGSGRPRHGAGCEAVLAPQLKRERREEQACGAPGMRDEREGGAQRGRPCGAMGRGQACSRKGGTRKETHATEWGERGRAGGVPHVCPPGPFPGDESRPRPTAPTGGLHGTESSRSLPYQSRAPSHLGSLFKVWGGERRRARAASQVPKHSLMTRFCVGRLGEAAGPGWRPVWVWVWAWPQRRLPLTWW